MRDFKELKQKLLQNNQIKEEYNKLTSKYKLIEQILEIRLQKGITQKELANRLNTKQSAIARFESGSYNPTLSFLQELVKALDCELDISIKQSSIIDL